MLGMVSWGWVLWDGVQETGSWGWVPVNGVLGMGSWRWGPRDGSWGWCPGDGVLGMGSWDGVLGTGSRATESWERAHEESRGTGSLETWSLGRGPRYGIPGDGVLERVSLGMGSLEAGSWGRYLLYKQSLNITQNVTHLNERYVIYKIL